MLLETELGRSRWLQRRTKGIGGSDVAPILGLSHFRDSNQWSVWLRKLKKGYEKKKTPAMDLGLLLEPVVDTLYQRDTGRETVDPRELLQHADHDILIASPDRLVRGQRRGVELKTAGYPDESWGEPGSDVIPLDYALQCRHYMAVCDVDVWDLGVLFLNTRNYATYTLYRDRATEDATNAYLLEWWDRYIVHGEPLPLDASDSCAEGLAVKHGKPRPEKVKATPELEAMLTQWQQADAAVKGWADQKALLENSIRDAMGATEVLTSAIGSVHWKERAGRPYTNFTGILKDLVERHGVDERVVAELRKLHTTESPGYRHFQIYPRNETAK